MATVAEEAIHTASSKPSATIGFQLPMVRGKSAAEATLTAKAHFRRDASAGISACFQRASGPTPVRNRIGVTSGMNTALKYGGPTEILPMPRASMNSG